MKSLFLALFTFFTLFLSLPALANCEYSLEYSILEYEGYSINFGEYLHQKMSQKNYNQGSTDSPAIKTIFSIKQQNQFEHAEFELEFEKIKTIENKRCFTQSCAISDVKKVLKQGIDNFIKKLPACR